MRCSLMGVDCAGDFCEECTEQDREEYGKWAEVSVEPVVLRRFHVRHDVTYLVVTCLARRRSCVVEEVV